MNLEAKSHMTTLHPRIGTLVVTALILIVTWPMSLSAEEDNDKVRVNVMNFEDNSSWRYGGDNLGLAAADELVTQLFRTGKFSLIERSQIEAVLAEQDFGQSGRVNSDQAAEIGRILWVQMILTVRSSSSRSTRRAAGSEGFAQSTRRQKAISTFG